MKAKFFSMNQKGQASVSDAMFFLVICGALAGILFFFLINYGQTLQVYSTGQYKLDYSTSALKSILYMSVPRNTGETLEDAKEVDYLLAIIKQDYGKDQKLSDETKQVLRSQIKQALSGLSGNFDYMFSIQEAEGMQNYVFIYMRVSNFEGSTVSPGNTAFKCGSGSSQRGEIIVPETGKAFKEYFCTAKKYANIQSLLNTVGDVSQSYAGITLVKANGSSLTQVMARADLRIWTGTCLPGKVLLQTTQNLEDIKWDQEPFCNKTNLECVGKIVCNEITSP